MRNRVIKHFKLRRNVSNNDILKCIHFNRDKKITKLNVYMKTNKG